MLYCNDGRVLNKNNILVEENSKIEIKNSIIDMINFLNKKFDHREYKYTNYFKLVSKIIPSYLKK